MLSPESENKTLDDLEADEAQQFGELLRLAGPRSEVPEARQARARDAVRKRWRRELRVRRARRLAATALAGLAAAAGLVSFLRVPLLIEDSETYRSLAPQMAKVERTVGDVRILRSAGRAELPQAPIRVGDRIATGATGRAALLLDAGSSLRVDVDSALLFVSEDRLLLERGAVYLDLSSEQTSTRDIGVETAFGSVRHIGTQFEVRVDQSRLSLRVREGAAAVDRGSLMHRVVAGVELKIDASGVTTENEISAYDPVWRWTQEIAPAFELEGETLAAFLEWTQRETGWSVHLDEDLEDSASEVILHGAIDGMIPEDAVRAVLPTCHVRFRIEDGRLLVARL